jgi:hypothetical protein
MQRSESFSLALVKLAGDSKNPEGISARTSIEHILPDPVEAIMGRARITLISLLPVFWLLLSGQDLSACDAGCANTSSSEATCALHDGHYFSSEAFSSLDISARRTVTRAGKSGKGGAFSIELISPSHAVDGWSLAFCPAGLESPAALARRWQFDYRAAPHPRAPSSVS